MDTARQSIDCVGFQELQPHKQRLVNKQDTDGAYKWWHTSVNTHWIHQAFWQSVV
jgi:hypothetical protein